MGESVQPELFFLCNLIGSRWESLCCQRIYNAHILYCEPACQSAS